MLWHLAALVAAAAAPSPVPATTAAPPSDPCGSMLSIVTRPTVTTSVCAVQPGHVLLENGYTNTVTTGPGGGVTASYPQSLLRIGTFDPHLDFEFSPPSANRSSVGGTLAGGASDMNFGAKYELGYTAKASWGVNAVVSIPTGKPAFSAGAAQFDSNFNWTYTLSPVFGLAGTVGFNANSGYDSAGVARPYFALVPSLVLSASLPASSSLYAEYAYYSQAGFGLQAKSVIDAGYSFDLGKHVQFDVEYGISPTSIDGQTQHYTGAGLSIMY